MTQLSKTLRAKPQTKRLFIDQYGGMIWATSARDLREQAGGRLFKIYRDKTDGPTVHVGYGCGHRWFLEYTPVERPV